MKKNSALALADTELSLDPEVKNMDGWSGMSVVISSYDAFPVFSCVKIRIHPAQKREIMLVKKIVPVKKAENTPKKAPIKKLIFQSNLKSCP